MSSLSKFLQGEPASRHSHRGGRPCPFRYHLAIGLFIGILLGVTAAGSVLSAMVQKARPLQFEFTAHCERSNSPSRFFQPGAIENDLFDCFGRGLGGDNP